MTIPAPYQLRVLNERAELKEKVDLLGHFIACDISQFAKLPADEQERMSRQHTHMSDYLKVLDERISAF